MESEGLASVGVDPGRTNGAVVCLSPRPAAPHVVLGGWAWTLRSVKQGDVWRLTDTLGRVSDHGSLHGVGEAIVSRLGVDVYTLTLEGLYVDALKKASRIITLAEAAGEVVGPLRRGCVGPVRRPLASVWRGKVLRLGRASAAVCAARAVECAPLVATGLGALEGNEHTCEALCIGYYGLVMAGRDDE